MVAHFKCNFDVNWKIIWQSEYDIENHTVF